MCSEPLSNLANAEFPLGDGVHHQFVCCLRVQPEVITVDAEKSIGGGAADSLVAVEEGMVIRKELHKCHSLMNQLLFSLLGQTQRVRGEMALLASGSEDDVSEHDVALFAAL